MSPIMHFMSLRLFYYKLIFISITLLIIYLALPKKFLSSRKPDIALFLMNLCGCKGNSYIFRTKSPM